MTIEAADKAALDTVGLLSHRLQRIEFLLTGSDAGQEQLQDVVAQGRDQGVATRLTSLESSLAKLASESANVQGLLTLHAAQPDIFRSTESEAAPAGLSTPEILAIISSSATSYPTTASRLTSMKDLPVPPAESSAALIALRPRLARLQLLQESQDRELAELRLRSAAAVKRWYELGVLGGSECWAEWEDRMTGVEKMVRREEGLRARELEANEAYKT